MLWLLCLTAGVAAELLITQPSETEKEIFPERYSPTTDVVSFSPATWKTQISHPHGHTEFWHGEPQNISGSDSRVPFLNERGPLRWPPKARAGLNSLVLMQHTCRLDDTDEAQNCYLPLDQPWLTPFNQVDSDSKDARYSFVRQAVWARAGKASYGNTTKCVWGGFDNVASINCGRGNNNSWGSEGAICNDDGVWESYGAWYHMADLLYPEDCRWTILNTSNAAKYIREVAPRKNDLYEPYDYSFEMCQRRGDCTPDDANCINTYSAVALADSKVIDSKTLFVLGYENTEVVGGKKWEDKILNPPRQYPEMGSGRIEAVYATAANGPHLPCPVNEAGQQVPCGVPSTQHPGQPLLNFEAEQDLVIQISRLKVNALKAVSSAQFTVDVVVTLTWASKYAVHPCGIDLYRGVVGGEAVVPAKDWWRPVVAADGAISSQERFESGNPVLQVHRTAGNATHEPEPVTRPCTQELCPWRAQVYLQEHVLLEMTFKSDFNLNRFPFDTQVLTGSFFLADKISPGMARRTSFSFDSPGYSDAGLDRDDLEGIYTKSDWTPRSAVVRPSSSSSPGANCRKQQLLHLCADFEIHLERVAVGNVFRVLVPAFVQMGLTTLAALQPAATRLQVLALGAIATAALLQPRSLGLPADTEGVPFVMALTICQLAVVGLMLVVTGYQLVLTAGVGRRTDQFCTDRRAALVGEWKAAFVAKRALEEQLPGGAHQPVAPADVSLSLSTGEPLGAGKEQVGSPPAEPVSLLTRAVLALPALIHHASQSTLPKPTHPHGEGSMGGSDWICAEDKALVRKSAKIDTWMALMLPPLYILLTSLLLGLYWSGAMDR